MQPPESRDHLSECLRLLPALSDLIIAVQSFRGRWSAISSTLNRLRVEDIAGFQSNDLSEDFFRSLSETLQLGLSLSGQCRAVHPPAGRLRTQSELDALAASLEQLASDSDVLIRTGEILQSPVGASRREALRAEARMLITRLQVGTMASRLAALESLMAILCSNEKNVLIAVGQGLVAALLGLLDFSTLSHGGAREKTVAAIARVCSVETCRHLLISEGVPLVSHLSRVLAEPDGGGSSKEKACAVLQSLTLQRDIAMTVGFGGSIFLLLETCRFGTPHAQATAAGVLKNLASLPELHHNFMEDSALPVLIQILQSGTVPAQENAAACLANLVAGEESQNQTIRLAAFQEGALDCIRNYLDTSAADLRNLEPAIKLLRNFSSSSFFADVILSAGFLRHVILALDCSSGGTRTEAARTISELAAACSKPTRDGVEFAVPRLISMLEAKTAEEKEASVKALASLMGFTLCRKLMKKDEKGIFNVVTLLDPTILNLEKKYAVSVLLAVSQTRKSRKLVVAAGARGFLPWLVEMQVSTQ
ncbi:hypothetical protein HPP92_019679 [Vanilla planifolia]|uniref:DUF7032 domain-containing protein n=1 Tax=Vanilla planifolia TaxID=51239 RepID=A0A835Q3A9_VANPL|nr:hypothetical protein HPP92_019679 [Vanilla planifolia]